MARRAVALALVTLVGCSTILYGRNPSPADDARVDAGRLGAGLPRVASPVADPEHIIHVALFTGASSVRVSATGPWQWYEGDGRTFLARGQANEPWRVEHNGGDVRAVQSDGMPTAWKPRALVARADDSTAYMLVDGKRYRGELRLEGSDTGLVVIETVGVEEYLRGVVPLELGDRAPGDSAALQAQAVTARSYAYTHLEEPASSDYDLTAGVLDQVYGGVDAETDVGNAAVTATAGIVVIYGGRVVNAPYSSTCGGETAAPSEVWHSPDEPYLRPVSDRIPGTDRYYCDIAPRFKWTRTLSASDLNAAVARYLSAYASVPGGDPGLVRDVWVINRTPSGRVGQLRVQTTLGSYILRGNDMRYVLRNVGGEILNSTYFSVATERTTSGALARLVLDGRGYGHGVGMCQWGAIGRARAGQDFRTILRTYYPGTALGVVQ
ncbi:MAG: SpoIID/LytB domain-containing protein [Gemmatimonadaceae bacterium]